MRGSYEAFCELFAVKLEADGDTATTIRAVVFDENGAGGFIDSWPSD